MAKNQKSQIAKFDEILFLKQEMENEEIMNFIRKRSGVTLTQLYEIAPAGVDVKKVLDSLETEGKIEVIGRAYFYKK